MGDPIDVYKLAEICIDRHQNTLLLGCYLKKRSVTRIRTKTARFHHVVSPVSQPIR